MLLQNIQIRTIYFYFKKTKQFTLHNYFCSYLLNLFYILLFFQEMGNPVKQKIDHLSSELEGQEKIISVIYLKVNPFKKYIALPFVCLITCFVLLAIMKVWQKVKVVMIYDQCQSHQATHLLAFGISQTIKICQIVQDANNRKIFEYKKVKFELYQNQFSVVSLKLQDFSDRYQNYIKTGLSLSEYQASLKQYGYCEHQVEILSIFQYMFHQLTSLFILLQYVINIIYLVQKYYSSVISNFCILFFILIINYLIQRYNLLRIKQIAQRESTVEVLRDSVYKNISSKQLVPGDLFIPDGQLACDAILLRGQIYVNEAGLTGENIPIAKFCVEDIKDIKETSMLHEGTKVVQARIKPLAMVLYTGFITKKGRILRKILFKHVEYPQFLTRISYMIIQTLVICLIIYIVALSFWVPRNVNQRLYIFQLINILGDVIPLTYLSFLNFCYTFSLYRLKKNNVMCTQSCKTIDSGKVKIMCFDKTGTLTKNVMKIYSFIDFQNGSINEETIKNKKLQSNSLKSKIFATCHAVKKIQNQFFGDQLDLSIYRYSDYQYSQSKDLSIISIYKKDDVILEVLKINQFQSKFQSMSVIVRDRQLDKYYIFVKGAPQKIYESSIKKPDNFNLIVKNLSLKGLRSLAFGYKQITQTNIKKYLDMERSQLQKEINLFGIMTFQNELKQDCVQTIKCIKEADIEIKMITGDNIYIAIETAIKSQIISQNDKILVLKGEQQISKNKYLGQYLYKLNETLITQDVQMTSDEYLDCRNPIAIDNKFLQQNHPLIENIKIYARALPESKATIIRILKQQMNQKQLSKGIINTLFGKTEKKIAMVGDETNDLIAIKQADIGIGFNNTESGFTSHFSVNNLIDIEYVIRQGKNCITILVQVIRYNILINIEKYASMMIMTIDYSSYGDHQYSILTYPIFFVLAIFLLMGQPSKKISKTVPNDNLFSVGYNAAFLFQLCSFMLSLLILLSMLFAHPEFVPTIKKPNLWTLQSQPNTLVYFSNQLYFVLNILNVFRSDPWKSQIWKNYILFIWWLILIAIGICTILIVPFNETSNRILDIIKIPSDLRVSICWITIVSALLGIGCEHLIRYFKQRQWI